MIKNLPKDTVLADVKSPVGILSIIVSDKGLHAVLMNAEKEYRAVLKKLKQDNNHPTVIEVKKQLNEYFAGKRKIFDLPLVMDGTEFQKKAWKQLLKIPYSKTICYSEQARRVGDVKKARAVGIANSKNPISIIVPCHRVIGKNGSLTGFGGGIENKKILIDLECGNI
ncbi:MAG: methylated-DNA--[protein]-cysteine S-methyltransferase [Proteobacteria bacterium]|nr:methylated-DNA--[protein]-cysteine S-methyltransferase [Pseudomonadota bacterium]